MLERHRNGRNGSCCSCGCSGFAQAKDQNKIKAGWGGGGDTGGGGGGISTPRTSDKHNNKDVSCLR